MKTRVVSLERVRHAVAMITQRQGTGHR
jgi:hypothetical protein